MAVRKPHITQLGIFFITFICYRWLPLFNITDSWDIVYKWFDHIKSNGRQIVGYVIMPNHVHVLINSQEADKSINSIVSNVRGSWLMN